MRVKRHREGTCHAADFGAAHPDGCDLAVNELTGGAYDARRQNWYQAVSRRVRSRQQTARWLPS
jgi:hypothetical protein